jgi:hypothetical protein
MWLCYLMAMIPLVVGFFVWLKNGEITFWEWALSPVIAFITCVIIHAISICGMTSDRETISGQLSKAVYHPQWIEKYTVPIYKTVTKTRTVKVGKSWTTQVYTDSVFSHYETRHRTHPEHWEATDTVNGDFDITRAQYDGMKANFGQESKETSSKSGFESGDPNIYVVRNALGYIYPTVAWKPFENRIKAAPSLFSYVKVPENIPIFSYPEHGSGWVHSDRLKGAHSIDILEWDRMNSRLGPTKKVNVIACNFGTAEAMMGKWQEAAWVGGRKNDLVICYGESGTAEQAGKPTWAYVFGWTEKNEVKRTLEQIVLENGLYPESLPLIEKEIIQNYTIKDWSKFDYITIDPPTWAYWVMVIVLVVTQGGYWFWAYSNDFEKEGLADA